MLALRLTPCLAVATLLAVAVLAHTAYAQAPPRGSGPQAIPPPVRVIEGDTFEVEIDGGRVGVVVAGIIAPPGNTSCGRQAIAAAQALVARGVELHEDLALPTLDRRLSRIYRVFDYTGRSLAEELARAGYAWPNPDTPSAVDRHLIAGAAAEASASRAGCTWQRTPPR